MGAASRESASGAKSVQTGSDSQLLATFCTTTVDDGAAVLGGHAGTETMSALALQIARLKCTFHCIIPTGSAGLEKGGNSRGAVPRCQTAISGRPTECGLLIIISFIYLSLLR